MIHTYQKKKLPLSSKKCATQMDWQMIYYANAVHGFTNPEYGNDNQKVLLTMKSCQTLFEHLKLFLNEVLKNNLVTPVIQNRYYE
jgi:hypothetical protein